MCGIFAWTGNSNKKFSWDKFNLLGVLNDERGGDSCGRVSGDIAQYGIHTEANYSGFIEKNKVFPIRENIIIGHDRKASVGYAITEDNAQPVILKEDGEVVFVLAHNGTIHNMEKLAEHYNVMFLAGETDSKILARIIYHKGFEVLQDYNGTASLVIYDRRRFLETGETIVQLFKGESKTSEYNKILSEERPLFISTKYNNSFYISSTESSLKSIGSNSKEIYSLKSNKVITIKDGVLQEEIIDIDRSSQQQIKEWESVNNDYKRNIYDYPYSTYNKSPIVTYKDSNKDIEEESLSKVKSMVGFKRGLYCADNELLNGSIFVNKSGDIVEEDYENSIQLFFLRGVLIPDYETYQKAFKEVTTANPYNFRTDVWIESEHKILLRYTKSPLLLNMGAPSGKLFYYYENDERYVYTGEYFPFFSDWKYVIRKGVLEKREYLTNLERARPTMNTKKSKEGNELMESEAASIMASVLESISNARSNLLTLGSSNYIDVLVQNLDTIEDTLFMDDEGSLYKYKLKLGVEWERPY